VDILKKLITESVQEADNIPIIEKSNAEDGNKESEIEIKSEKGENKEVK